MMDDERGLGAYKKDRRGALDGFLKRMKETPEMIFGTNPDEQMKRQITFFEAFALDLYEHLARRFNFDDDTAANYVQDFITNLFSHGKLIKEPEYGYYRKILITSINKYTRGRLQEESRRRSKFRAIVLRFSAPICNFIYDLIDVRELRSAIESGFVEACVYGHAKVHVFTLEEVRCWKLRYLDNLPRTQVSRICQFEPTRITRTVNEINTYIHDHADEILAAIRTFR